MEPEKKEHREGKAPMIEEVPARRQIPLTQVSHQQEPLEEPIEEVKRSSQRELQEQQEKGVKPQHQTQEELKEMLRKMPQEDRQRFLKN